MSITKPDEIDVADIARIWIILKADKTTQELTCAIRTSLPTMFLPR